MTPTEFRGIARKLTTYAAIYTGDKEAREMAARCTEAADALEALPVRAGTMPSEEEIAQAICKAAGWDWKDEATLNAGFMSCARAVLALSPKGSSEPRASDKEVLCACEEQCAEHTRLRDMIDNRNEFIAEHGLWRELGQYLSEPHAPKGSSEPPSVDTVRLALCLRTPCTYPDCGCEHSIHSIVRVLAGGEPTLTGPSPSMGVQEIIKKLDASRGVWSGVENTNDVIPNLTDMERDIIITALRASEVES